MQQQLAASCERVEDGWVVLYLPLQIGEPDARDRLERLLRVLLELSLLERLGRRDDPLQLRIAHLGLDGGELRLFGRLLCLGERVVGHELDGGQVRVVDDHALEQTLEDPLALGEPRLEIGQRRLKSESLGRRAAPIQPARQDAEHEREALGIAARVELAQRELDRVERRLDRVRLEAVLRRLFERLDRQCLHFGHVRGLYALEPDGEGGLLELIGESAAHERRAQPGLDHRLVQRRGGRAHKEMVEHP